jgi:hypothetical protein
VKDWTVNIRETLDPADVKKDLKNREIFSCIKTVDFKLSKIF